MRYRSPTFFPLACLLLLCAPLRSGSADPPKERTTWNYDGGIFMPTEGRIPNGPCFRLSGRLTSDDFFFNLRRVESNSGTFFRRGNDIVTEFPDSMRLSFALFDFPCLDNPPDSGPRVYLTKAAIASLRLGFAWKRGMQMRPAKEIVLKNVESHPIANYAHELTTDMPQRFEWFFEFDIPSKGVPVTDSLVLILFSPNGQIIARVAGRL